MIYLCDNPTCSSHCEIIKDNDFGWKFVNGFGIILTKEQLRNFKSELKLNFCVKCCGIYSFMLNRMREISIHISSQRLRQGGM